MSNDMLMYLMIIIAGLFVAILIAYVLLNNKLKSKETKYVAQLVKGTQNKGFSLDVFYQKLYISFVKIPFLRRYVLKVRRRLEVINLEDEYLTRMQTAKIIFRSVLVVIPLTIIIIFFTRKNIILMLTLFLFELVFY